MSFISLRRAALVVLILSGAGCGTIHRESTSLASPDSDKVVVVGRVELVPPLRAGEQKIRLGTIDPLDVKAEYLGRVIFHIDSRPTSREKTNEIFNPKLEETFFYSIPKDKRYIVDAAVTMAAHTTVVSRRQVQTETEELLIPVPIELEIKPDDRAIYIGTVRLHRDEFNDVTKIEILDQSIKAAVEFKDKFGPLAAFRKALVRVASPSAPRYQFQR